MGLEHQRETVLENERSVKELQIQPLVEFALGVRTYSGHSSSDYQRRRTKDKYKKELKHLALCRLPSRLHVSDRPCAGGCRDAVSVPGHSHQPLQRKNQQRRRPACSWIGEVGSSGAQQAFSLALILPALWVIPPLRGRHGFMSAEWNS